MLLPPPLLHGRPRQGLQNRIANLTDQLLHALRRLDLYWLGRIMKFISFSSSHEMEARLAELVNEVHVVDLAVPKSTLFALPIIIIDQLMGRRVVDLETAPADRADEFLRVELATTILVPGTTPPLLPSLQIIKLRYRGIEIVPRSQGDWVRNPTQPTPAAIGNSS